MRPLLCSVIGGVLMANAASASEITDGFEFSRAQFTFSGVSSPPTNYGILSVDYTWPGFASGGFINVATAEGWVVQNLPVDSSSGYPGISVSFNLGSSTSLLNANVDFSPMPIDNFLGVPGANHYVLAPQPIERNAEGQEEPVLGMEAPPAPSPPALFGGQGFHLVWQPNHETLEEAVNQCAPGAIARSLTYLKNRYNVAVPDPNQPGTGAANTANSLVAALDKAWIKPDGTPAGGRGANEGSKYSQTLNGTLNYIAAKSLPLGVEHHRIDKIYTPVDGGDFQSSHGGKSHDATNNATLPWLVEQLEFGSGIALNYANHHMTNVRGGGVILGRYFVILQDDAKQGEDGGVSWLDGGLSFTWLDWTEDGGAPVLSASTLPRISKLNGVNLLMAIHIVPEPATASLLLVATLWPLAVRGLRWAGRGDHVALAGTKTLAFQ